MFTLMIKHLKRLTSKLNEMGFLKGGLVFVGCKNCMDGIKYFVDGINITLPTCKKK